VNETTSSPSEPSRRWTWLLVPAFGCLAMMGTIAALAYWIGRDGADTPSAGPYRGSEPPARIMLPEFALTSYSGGKVSSTELRGKVVLLTILDAQCTDVCPIIASVVAGSVDRLSSEERGQVRALGITGDPAEDTPAAVRSFLSKRRAIGKLDYLLGTEKELRPLWTALQILPSLDTGRDTLHSAPLRIYDRAGAWVATLHAGVDLTEANLLHDIRTALAAEVKAA
jgi:protein SCO1/2